MPMELPRGCDGSELLPTHVALSDSPARRSSRPLTTSTPT